MKKLKWEEKRYRTGMGGEIGIHEAVDENEDMVAEILPLMDGEYCVAVKHGSTIVKKIAVAKSWAQAHYKKWLG